MSIRRKQIADRLQKLPGGVFQELAESYLKLRHPELDSINPAGSNEIEQKTTIGHPDTLFWTNTGKLVCLEAGTGKRGIVAKFEKDIKDCVAFAIDLNGSTDRLQAIYLCYNRKFKPEHDRKLIDSGNSLGVQVHLIGLTKLALDIDQYYHELARQYLSISFDTGQVMSIPTFVKFYGARGAGTSIPLDNVLVGGEERCQNLNAALQQSNIVLLSGPPGVGKTRIALETLRRREKKAGRRALVIIHNGLDIWEDLQHLLLQNHPIDILIDDANHHRLNLKQILQFMRLHSDRDLRIVMTVRDFAKVDLKNFIHEYDVTEVVFDRLSEEDITRIIAAAPYCILKRDVQRRIVSIASGSVRFAIMAARLARDDYFDFRRGGIGKLYEMYYSSYLNDFADLKKSRFLRVLGYLSFFRAVNLSAMARPELNWKLQEFGIKPRVFNKAIQELKDRELVDIQYDIVKLTEQNLATFFFYLAFLERKILDFKILLRQEFSNQQRSLRNILTEIYNDFGKEAIIDRIGSDLRVFTDLLNEEDQLSFYNTCWFLFEEDILPWAMRRIGAIQEVDNTHFHWLGNKRQPAQYSKDPFLELLAKLFSYDSRILERSLQLSFAYVRKRPDLLSELVHHIKNSLVYKEIDIEYGYSRQTGLFNFLLHRNQLQDELRQHVFLEVVLSFLQHEVSVHQMISETAISIRQIGIIEDARIIPLRDIIWQNIIDLFDSYPDKVLDIAKNIMGRYGRVTKKALSKDKEFLLRLFREKLSPSNLNHSILVNRILDWMIRQELSDNETKQIRQLFTTPDYQIFKDLDYNYLAFRIRDDDIGLDKFEHWKEAQLRKRYIFENDDSFTNFLATLKLVTETREAGGSQIDRTLSIIIRINLERDQERGLTYLCSIIEKLRGNPPSMPWIMQFIADRSKLTMRFLSFLLDCSKEFNVQHWLGGTFQRIPSMSLSPQIHKKYRTYLNNRTGKSWGTIETLKKFAKNDDELEEMLELSNQQVEKGQTELRLFDFEEVEEDLILAHYSTLSVTYLLHSKHDEHFDYKHSLLEKFLHVKPEFLVSVIELLYNPDNTFKRHHRDNKFGIIWKFDRATEIVNHCINIVFNNKPYIDFDTSPISMFFEGAAPNNPIVHDFVLDFIRNNCNDPSPINAIFACIRTKLGNIYEEAIGLYLSLNQGIDAFKKINWVSNGGLYNGDTIIGNLRAEEWRALGKMITNHTDSLDLLEIQNFIDEQVLIQKRWAQNELRRAFVGD